LFGQVLINVRPDWKRKNFPASSFRVHKGVRPGGAPAKGRLSMQRIGIVYTGFNAMGLQMSEQPVAFSGANHKQVMNRFAINTHQPHIFVLAQILCVN